jgi:hypothetical protein
MPPDQPEPPPDRAEPPPDQPEPGPTAAGFDATFSAVPASPGLRKPKHPGDRRLHPRARIDWPPLLHAAGFTDIDMAERPAWHALWTRLYQVALDLGDPGDDTPLADLQDEARRRLPLAGLRRRVVVTATAPA